MAVAVLNPRDFLENPSFSRKPLISPPKSKPGSLNPNRVAKAHPNRRKRSPPRSTNQSPPTKSTARPTQQTNLVAGHVRILKRGENIAPPATGSDVSKPDLDLGTTSLLGPAPELVPTRSKLAESNNKVALFYAGSAFFTSPPPSSVPLPGFFTRKTAGAAVTDDATNGLRRLLRLDLQ